MTEKRFELILDYSDEIGIKDNISGDVIVQKVPQNQNTIGFCNSIVYMLNFQTHLITEGVKETSRLRMEIQDFQELLTTREETFLKPIYTALDDAIQNERTALGKSALKQFKQTIME